MNLAFSRQPAFIRLLAGGAVLWLAGCDSIFTPKHRVLVDAIAAPGVEVQTSGASYRLMAKKATVASAQARVEVIKACVDAALLGKGMFEAPPNVPPDYFIEVGFGVDVTPRVDASARETFLQLSARTNPGRSLDRSTGAEVWDVRVAVLGVAGRVETAMPLLSSVAVDHIGVDTKLEMRIEIPQNSPAVVAVRKGAIKTLESSGPPAGAGGGAGGAAAAASAAVKPVTTK